MALSIRNRRLAIAGGVGTAATGLIAAMAMVGPRDGTGVRGPDMRIAHFVAAPAPIEPGTTMEVGELTDGYVHRPAPAVEEVSWIEPEDDWVYADMQDPPRYRDPEPRYDEVAQVRDEPARGDRYGFGFESRADVERRIVMSAPAERRPDPQSGDLPPPASVTGERQAVFY